MRDAHDLAFRPGFTLITTCTKITSRSFDSGRCESDETAVISENINKVLVITFQRVYIPGLVLYRVIKKITSSHHGSARTKSKAVRG